MARHILYAYAVEVESGAMATEIVERVTDFIGSRRWVCPEVWAVNPEDGELGLNLALPGPDQEVAGWYADVEAVVAFCSQLHREFGCNFMIGIQDGRTGCGEDIIEVESDRPDYEYLRRFIGAGPAKPGGV